MLHTDDFVPTLALAHPDPGAREAAAHALVAMGSTRAAAAVVPLIAHADVTVRNLAGEVLVRLGACAVEPLAVPLSDPDPVVRKFAVDVLAQLPAEALAPQIAGLLHDPDTNVRLSAVDALAALGAASPFVGILARLYRAEPLARAGVVAALSRVAGAESTRLIREAMTDEDDVVRLAAAEALAELDGEVLPLLQEALQEATGGTRAVVLDAIVRWCEAHPGTDFPEGLAEDLLATLDDPHPRYRCSAARGLRHVIDRIDPARLLAQAGRDDALDVALFDALSTLPDPFAALAAAGEAMRPAPAVSFAVALLAQGRVPAAACAEAAAFLDARFEALDADTKITVLTLCARLGHPELTVVLQAGLHDPDAAVAAAAADAVTVAAAADDAVQTTGLGALPAEVPG